MTLAQEVAAVAYLLLPLLGGGIFHGLCMKYDRFRGLKYPIDGGLIFRGRPLFGANKTWRGPIAIGLGAALTMVLQVMVLHYFGTFRQLKLLNYQRFNPALLGFSLGFVAMLAELPNSFLKRQFSVAPGQPGSGWKGYLFYVFDQVDLLLGAWLVLAFVMPVTLRQVLISAAIVLVVHQALTSVTYLMGMRASAR